MEAPSASASATEIFDRLCMSLPPETARLKVCLFCRKITVRKWTSCTIKAITTMSLAALERPLSGGLAPCVSRRNGIWLEFSEIAARMVRGCDEEIVSVWVRGVDAGTAVDADDVDSRSG